MKDNAKTVNEYKCFNFDFNEGHLVKCKIMGIL